MWLQSLLNSVLLYGIVLAIALPCSAVVSLVMMRTYLPGRKAIAALIFSAMTIPVYVQAGAWNSMFGQFGWWTLTQVGAIQNGWGGMFAVAFIQAAYVFPWMVLCLCYGLSQIDRQAEANAWLDAGPATAISRVTLPLLVPYLLLAMIVTIILLSTDMTVTNLYRVDTITERFYQQVSAGEVQWSALVLSVGQGVLIVTLLLVIYLGVCRKLHIQPVVQQSHGRQVYRELRFTISRSQMWLCGGFTWGLTFFWILLPVLNLFWNAGWTIAAPSPANRISGFWSFRKLLTTLWQTPFEFQAEFLWTLYIGSCAATVWLLLALASSFFWPVKSRWSPWALCSLLALVFVPGPLAGLATIYVWNRNWPPVCGWLYDHTLVGPTFALGVRMFPLAMFAVAILRTQLPANAQDVAKLDGVSHFRLWASWYGKNFSSLLGVWFLLFLLSVADLSSVLLVLPPGVTPISARIFELLHYGVRYQESGICLVMSLVSVIGAASTYFLSVRPHFRT